MEQEAGISRARRSTAPPSGGAEENYHVPLDTRLANPTRGLKRRMDGHLGDRNGRLSQFT